MSNEKNTIENGEEREVVQPGAGTRDKGRVQDDSAFLSGLNLRMKNADWSRYERGSEAFFDIDHDLEKLAKESPEKADQLWTENAPRGMRKPFYLAEELEKAPKGVEANVGAEGREESPKGMKREKDDGYEVPDALKKKYLAVENSFYFRDAENKLAFKDRGPNMVTEHNDPDVAKSMVDLAEAKGWSKIKVKGHDDFKREVWLQASLKGIDVEGYKPKDVDLAKLAELQKSRLKNVIERGEEREVKAKDAAATKKPAQERETKTKDDVAPARSDAVAKNDKLEQEKAGVIAGKLLEHGPARFDFDEKNEPSYYVKVETTNGTKIHWGVDLSRAVGEAKVQVGEKVELERLGKDAVTVQEKQFDKDGAFKGTKEVGAERAVWEVRGEAQIAERTAALKASRVAEDQIWVRQGDKQKGDRTPKEIREWVKLDNESFNQITDPKLKELARARIADNAEKRPDYRKEVAAKFPDLAKAIDVEPKTARAKPEQEKAPELKGEYKVVASVMADVLREKGYSPRTIEKAVVEAAKRLDGMSKEGVPPPGVKKFDKDAPREVVREKMQRKDKDKDVERTVGGR